MKEKIQCSDYPFPVPFLLDLIRSNGIMHSVCITYYPIEQTWQFMDANYFPPQNPNMDIVKALKEMPFDAYEAFSMKIILPTQRFSQPLVDLILEIPPLAPTIYSLLLAAQSRSLSEVTSILKTGIDPNTTIMGNKTLLHLAIEYGYHQIIEELLKWGADVNTPKKDGYTPLHLAVEYLHSANNAGGYTGRLKQYHLIKLLLINGADVHIENKDGFTALHIAAVTGNHDVIGLLLKHGININSKNKEGCTALHIAVINEHHEIACKLLECGADVNVRNNQGSHALHLALSNRYFQIVAKLLKFGADVQVKNNYGYTPLYIATHHGNHRFVHQLLQYPQDINAKSSDGNTTLHRAAYMGFVQIVKLHLQHRSDANAINNEGRTPLFFAAYKGNIDVVIALLKYPGLNRAKSFLATPKFLLDLISTISTKENGISSKMEKYIRQYQQRSRARTHIEITPLIIDSMTGSHHHKLKPSFRF